MMTSNITFRSDFDVTLIDSMGSDLRICQAARVSTQGAESFSSGESEGLINFLIKNRHGSPFEHGVFTWMVRAPIFVWREFMRHRIASYNEESGRYKQLEPVFYIPPRDRPLQQIGKAGAYEFVPGSEQQYEAVGRVFRCGAYSQYADYKHLLELGIAREVARMELPLNIYSTAFVTMNVRGLMNFLSLRTKSEEATYKSFPQWEIEKVAFALEEYFAEHFPTTWNAFCQNGRVQP